MKMFHVTGAPLVDKILAEGLRSDALGYDTGYVWLFDNRDVAEKAVDGCRTWGGYPKDELVILEVDTTGLDVIPDPHNGWGDERDLHSFAYAGNVPPDRVRADVRICYLPAP